MSAMVDLECPRCGETQKDAWFNRKICCSCRTKEEKDITNGPKGIAWRTVIKSLRIGNIARLPCEVCGAEKVDAHHDDYSKPLEVRWLCRRHHRLHHARFGAGLNDFKPEEAA